MSIFQRLSQIYREFDLTYKLIALKIKSKTTWRNLIYVSSISGT